MVRFARADGSKGSNKRVLEEPTPWSDMVAQMKIKEVGNSGKEKKDTANEVLHKEKTSVVNENDNATNASEDCESLQKSPLKSKKRKKGNKEAVDKSEKSSKEGIEKLQFVFENNQKFQVLENGKKRPWFDLPYEESDRMTRYEGFWMKPEMVKQLDDLKENLKTTMDTDVVRKKMMKAKRKAHKELTRELINEQRKLVNPEISDVKEEENNDKDKDDTGKKKEEEELEVEGALFDGYWITKEGAVRLKKLRADLGRKGVPKEKQRMIIKSERRKEEKALRREKRRVCLRCRKRGHMVNECPEAFGEYGDEQKFICYACGSTEHRVSDCPQASEGEGFPHATCFVCRRVGHISRQCPDNPRGLYPNGGSCRGCGSVVHLAANCPLIQEEHEQATIKVGRIDGSAVEALDVDPPNNPVWTETKIFKKKKGKVVTF